MAFHRESYGGKRVLSFRRVRANVHYTLFGKTMYDLVRDGMNDKLMNIPPDAREKLSGVLERIINEGAGGLICILL